MCWLYKNELLTDDMIPEKSAGFIYMITDKETGKRYIGRKLLTKSHTRQKNKKKIRTRVESDWRSYWSSSPFLQELVEEKGTDNFIREVLVWAFNKSQLMYLEEKFLYSLGTMESDDWYNSNIRSKVMKRNIIGKIDTEEVNSVLRSLEGSICGRAS